jgi:hypothetical protein
MWEKYKTKKPCRIIAWAGEKSKRMRQKNDIYLKSASIKACFMIVNVERFGKKARQGAWELHQPMFVFYQVCLH